MFSNVNNKVCIVGVIEYCKDFSLLFFLVQLESVVLKNSVVQDYSFLMISDKYEMFQKEMDELYIFY